jgi:hypothetical protein
LESKKMGNGPFESMKAPTAALVALAVGGHFASAGYIALASERCQLMECKVPDEPGPIPLAQLSTGTVTVTGPAQTIVNTMNDVLIPVGGPSAGATQTLPADLSKPPQVLQVVTAPSGYPSASVVFVDLSRRDSA